MEDRKMIKIEKEENGVNVFVGGFESCDTQEETFNWGLVGDICRAFSENGYNVSPEAIWHNYEAWADDYKSGYRDDEKGYFLFSPCGCNQLRFFVEGLNGKDYQHTYEA